MADESGDSAVDGESSAAGERPIYNVPFAWDSSHGHVVELLVEHAEPGLVVDIGCGYAPHAERLQQRGFGYVGVDADPAAVEHLRGRGFLAAVADADDPDALLSALETVTSGTDAGSISAVLALDVLEHLVSPHLTVDAVVGWMASCSIPLLGISLPNVSHDDVVLKLMTGRLDMTPSGLLDHTHLRLFTDRSFTAMMSGVGMSELARNDVISPTSDQDWPEVHPALSDGALLGSYLRRVRALSDPHGSTFQFVRLFTPVAVAERAPTLLSERPVAPTPGITALVSPRCGDDAFAAAATQLESQRDAHLVVLRPDADADLASAIGEVETTHVALVAGGEQFAPTWAAQLMAVADRYPGAVIRCGPLEGGAVDDTLHDRNWSAGFSLFDHYLGSETPSAAVAFPTAFVRELSAVGDADSDWPALAHELLMEAAPICGVVDTGTGAVAPGYGWRASDEVVAATLQRGAVGPSLAPSGSSLEVAKLLDQLRSAHAAIADLETTAAQLRGDVDFLNGELARTPVRATRKVMSVVDRFTRRG